MSTKKLTLSMEHKLQILQELENGLPVKIVADKYSVHPMTIRRIRRSGPNIRRFVNQRNENKQRQRMRRPANEELEERLYRWFVERRTFGDVLTDMLFKKKATELKKELSAESTFKESGRVLTGEKSTEEEIDNSPLVCEQLEKTTVVKEEVEIEAQEQEEAQRQYEHLKEQQKSEGQEQQQQHEQLKEEQTQEREEERQHEHLEEIQELELQEGTFAQSGENEDIQTRTRRIFGELEELGATEPKNIRLVIEALKIYFLEEKQ
ncbi:uncharacterized protein LOC143185678 [Calliopsis andreniformis]|uniref:uncharacterized protein LOC143185678 n=1 Tax=Calliopsis andreniformis TaxID=337506 RepID=UPI003FCE1A2E